MDLGHRVVFDNDGDGSYILDENTREYTEMHKSQRSGLMVLKMWCRRPAKDEFTDFYRQT